MSKTKTQACPECGGVMHYETRREVLSYKGHEQTIETLGWWCSKCGEGILSGEPLAAQEKAFLELKAKVDDVLSPAQVAAVRMKLGLSQREAGELLGGGPRSFQKYEAGKQAVSTSMSHLLRLLDNDVSRLEEVVGGKPGARRQKGIVGTNARVKGLVAKGSGSKNRKIRNAG